MMSLIIDALYKAFMYIIRCAPSSSIIFAFWSHPTIPNPEPEPKPTPCHAKQYCPLEMLSDSSSF